MGLRRALALVVVLTISACGTTVLAPTTLPTTASTSPDAASSKFPPGFIPARQAAAHVGETALVCGRVAGGTYAAESQGSPTFLNLEEPYPDSVFTILIWSEDRQSFGGSPESTFLGHQVCIEGQITMYQGIAQIISEGADIRDYGK